MSGAHKSLRARKTLSAVILAVLCFASVGSANAQLLLANYTSPSSAVVGSPVTLSGCGFPTGVTAANTVVTFTPAPGAGSAVQTAADSVTVTNGGCYNIGVTVPTNIVAGNTAVTVANAATTAPVFSSTNFSTVLITDAPMGITLNTPASPSSAVPGTVITLIASGFTTASPIPAGNVIVTIQPATGPAVSVPASTDPFIGGGTMQVTFLLPNGLAAGTSSVTIASAANTSPPFISITSASLDVLATASSGAPLGPISPSTVAEGRAVSMKANGLPTGTIPAGNILVTVTPPPGNGSPITVPATLYLSSIKQINFPISTGLTNNSPILCGVSITNKPGTTPTFSLTGATVTVTPPPTVAEVTPGVGQAGTSVPVQIVGDFTHFGTTSTLSFTPFANATAVSTITASNISVVTTTLLNATLNVASDAIPGAYTVNVTTGTEKATSGAAFVVTTSPGLSFNYIAPNGGALGQTLTGVMIQASNTHFSQGDTILDMGTGIQVTSLTVVDATDLLANITISPTTSLGTRTVTAVTGGEFAVGTDAFTVAPSAAALVSPITPSSGAQGTNVVGIQITGSNTHFLAGATKVAFGGGINTGQVVVSSPTSLTVDISIPPGAAIGGQNLTVTTGGEVVSLSNAFTVLPGTPYISVQPTTGQQGQTLDVVIAGTFTNFQPGAVTVSFGSGDITVNSVTVDPVAQTATANISIGPLASVGGRTVTVVSTTTTPSNYTFSFGVTAAPASITSICVAPSAPPNCINAAPQGSAPTLLVTGLNTLWVQGTTQASGGVGLNVDVVTINSPTSATLNVTIPPNAPVGANSITFSTGGQVVSGPFTILASTATMIMSPTQGLQGTSVPVTFTGDFTHWCDNATNGFACGTGFTPTTAVIDGAGVTIQNFTITSPASATATLAIAPTATLGGRTITLTTGSEIVTTPFSVTDIVAYINSLTPFHSGQATTVGIEIVGVNTNFTQGVTTVGLGPDIAVSNVVVNSSTDLTATLTIDGQAAFGWRPVYVNTISSSLNLDEQLTSGFRVDAPASPVLTGISPSVGYQGQVLTVQITGVNTNWQQGVTQAIVGGEITINSLTINSPTSATAEVTISPYAPLGGNSVVMITGSEVDSGPGLSVSAGPAQILGLCRGLTGETCGAGPVLVGVGQTVTVNITGQATHFQQGATVATFGGGQIYTDSFTVVDPTHAYAQITVLSTATPGFQSVTLTTLGEVATIAQGMDLVNSSPELLSTTPNGAQQGATLNVQILGQFTHWCDNVTTQCLPGYTPTVASLGPGALINSITVQDSETAVVNVTVDPVAYPTGSPCPSAMMTTGTEQVTLLGQFCVLPGPATLTGVTPSKGPQGQTTTVTVTGLLTHFVAGETVADFGPNVQVANVDVLDSTHAKVDLAITANAPVGFVTATLRTLGETASLQQAFQVVPGTPTLNEVSAVQAQQGQSLTGVQIFGQYTHWCDNVNVTCASGYTPTTITFGQGITVSNLQVVSSSEATVDLAVDPLAFLGSRDVTVTTGTETVSKYSLFNVVAGPAIISQVTPSSANQGQEVVLTITGLNTHWQQGLTQVSVGGAGYDLTINAVTIQSATSAQVDVTFSPTAGLGARSVYMVTAGEALTDSGAIVVTGGIPSITGVSPNSAKAGTFNVNVMINGQFTCWLSCAVSPATNAVSNVDFGTALGSGIDLVSYTVNSDTSITAVVNVSPDAPLQYNKITVTGQTKNQNGVLGVEALTGYFQVYSPAPPVPYIQWMSPSSGLPGQTMDVRLIGNSTHWDPVSSQITFGAGINVVPGTFSVTSPTSAIVTISIDPAATGGYRTVYVDTGSEEETTNFDVVIATPSLAIVDPGSGLQGAQGLTVNVIGNYTTFNDSTVFQFGGVNSGITVTNTQILGPTIAQVTLNISQTAPLGGSSVTATTTTNTGVQVATGAGFSVTPSLATILSIAPNTGYQGNGYGNGSAINVTVTGEFTHWDNTTTFALGDGITVSNVQVTSATTATMDVSIPPLAGLGATSVTATTGGEIATLNNAFVVQAGTPIILSASTGSGAAYVEQQQTVPITILGQVTHWDSTTTVTYGPGFIISTPVNGNLNCNGSLNPGQVGYPLVTSPTAMTVCVTAQPLTYMGGYTLTVTTADQGNQVLTLPYSLFVTQGPAAVTSLNPPAGSQGQTLDVTITGTNTNFVNGTTVANFGQGISVNGAVNVTSPTSATANITIAANANPQLNTVTLATLGESASDPSAFQVVAATPVIQFVNPSSLAQGATANLTVTGAFTHFAGNTLFNFGPGVIQNSIQPGFTNTSATVNVTVSPIAATGTFNVTATTGSEVAQGINKFSITAGPAVISSLSTTSARQNQNGLSITVVGSGTHFTQGTPVINLGPGILITNTSVSSDTSLTVTVNISQTAPVETNTVTVTTGGEVAVLNNAFTVLPGLPIVSSVSPTTIHQGQTVQLTVNGLYTHFDSGITGATFSPNDVTFVSVAPGATSTQAVITVTVSNTAQLVTHSITISDPTDGTATGTGVFAIAAGIPALVSVSPNTGSQGSLNQPVVINGNPFTHFSSSSVVTFSGSGITAGPVQFNSVNQLTVPVSVAQGTPQGFYTVTVTTGSEVASLNNGFQVLPGVPTIQSINQNVGVANSTQTVTIGGTFTNFVSGQTTANFGPYVSVGGAAQGASGPITVNSATSATANLVIASGAPVGAYTVTITDPADGTLTVTNGFTIQSTSPVAPSIVAAVPVYNATNVPTNTKFTFELNQPIQNASTGNVILFDQSIGGFNCYYGNPAAGAAAMVPGTVTTDASGRIVTFAPNQNLKVGNAYLLCINGTVNNWPSPWSGPSIQSQGTTPLNLGYNYYAFTTGFGPDTNGPSLTYSNISNNDTGVGTNAVVTLGFSVPVNPASVNASTFYVTQSGNSVPGTISYNSSFTQFTFTPSPAFSPNTAYTVTYNNGITDWTDTPLSNPGSFTFTTGVGTITNGLSFVTWTPCCSEQTGLNPTISFTVNRPVNPLSISPGTFVVQNQATGWTIPGATVSFSNDNRTVTLTLPSVLDPGTNYFWRVSGYDEDGNSFTGYDYFSTDSSSAGTADTTAPTVNYTNPAGGSTNAPLNPQIRVQMNKMIDWNSVAGSTVTFSPPLQSVIGNCSLVPGNLVTNCGFESGNTTAWALSGNSGAVTAVSAPHSGSYSLQFNNSSPAATASQTISDTNGASYTFTFFVLNRNGGSPELFQASWNGTVLLNLGTTVSTFGWTEYQYSVTGTGSDTISFTGYNNPSQFLLDDVSVTATPAGSVATLAGLSLASDHQTVNFGGGFLLAANTSYTATVSGLKDVDGNTMVPYSWTFASGTTSTQITSPGTVSVSPSGSGIATNSNVVLTLSAPVDANSVNNHSIDIFDNTAYGSGYAVAGSYAVSGDGLSVTFKPEAPFEPNHQICVYVSWNATLYDTSGNAFNTTTPCFTTAGTADTTAPTVVSITPPNTSTGIGPNNPVTVIFSKPMAPGSFNNGDVGLYVGSNLVTSNVSISRDTTSFTFNTSLNYSTTYTVVLTPNVTDLAGNHLAAQVTSSFTTMDRPSTSDPVVQTQVGCNLCVTGFRPGSGATSVNPTNPVTFFISAPLNASTVTVGTANTTGTMYVAQNGVLFDGTATLSANNQVITFTPSGGSFTPGVVVSVYLTNGITDPFGNALTPYSASFTVAQATANTAPVLTTLAPSYGTGGVALNTVIDARFNQPLDPATATTSNFFVLANNNISTPVSGSVTPLLGNVLLRFTPAAPLSPNTCYWVYLTSGLANTTGQNFNGSNTNYNSYFCTGTATNTATPKVTAIEPTDGSTDAGINALVRISFNEGIDIATVGSSTVTLTANGNAIPYTFTYTSGDGNVGFAIDGPNQLVLTPQAPLPSGTQITVSVTDGVTDGSGNPVSPQSATFTSPGPDFDAPRVAAASVAANDVNVPVNSVFTITFGEAMDTRSFQLGNTVRLVDTQFSTGLPNNEVPAVMTFTADGREITIAPVSPLAANRQYYLGVCNVYDLTGNSSGCWAILNYFTTALNAPANLAVINTTPPTGFAATVGTNFHPEIQFNQPISEPSAIANITLLQNGNPVPATLTFSNADTVVTVSPNVILQGNTAYSVNINGGPTGLTDAAAAARSYTTDAYLHTGDSGVGTPFANGAADTNWTVSGPSVPAGNAVVLSPAAFYGGWQANDLNSQWIGVQNIVNAPAAPYTFTTTFNVTNPSTAVLNAWWGIDDAGSLALNGNIIASGSGIYSLQNVVVGGSTGVFVAGTNTLTITMTSSDRNYEGVRLVGTVSEQSTNTPAVGTYLPSSVSVPFTTSASLDLTGPSVTSITPIYGSNAGTNPVLRVRFNEPVDPLRAYGWYLYNQVTGGRISITPTWSADLTSVTFSYANYVNSSGNMGQLDPNTGYQFFSGYFYDLLGNGAVNANTYFTTGAGVVGTSPSVVQTTPPANSTGVPLNTIISLQMSEPIDPTSLNASAITLNGAQLGNVQLSSDGISLTYALSGNLASGSYTLNIPAGAFADLNGNAFGGYSLSFTTGSSAFSGNGSISLTSPAANSVGVPVGTSASPTVITLTLSKAVDPLTVTPTAFEIFQTNNSNYPISGTIALGSNNTLTFTPSGPLPANSQLYVYASWGAALRDLAGNQFNCLCYGTFSTGAGTPHAPAVAQDSQGHYLITPANNSTGNGPNTVVTIPFNEALNGNTINGSNFALYNGYTNLNAGINYSSDRHIVTLSAGNLPYGTQLTVYVGTGIQDLDGNHMAQPFTSAFSTIARPVIGAPSVVQIRPGNGTSGVTMDSPITLYTSSPVNAATVNSNTVGVLENGVAVPGSYAVGVAPATAEGQTIVFTPTQPFTASGVVQVFLTSAVTDVYGNAFSAYSAQFNIQGQPSNAALTGPSLTGVSPSNGCNCAQNSVVVATFDQAIAATSASTANFYLLANNGGSPIGVSVTQIAPNQLELTPGPLAANTYYYVYLTTGIQNQNGLPLIGGSSSQYRTYFYTGAGTDSALPVVNEYSPTNGAINIGDNAILGFTFNDFVKLETINPGTVTLTANGNAIPFTLSFGTNYNNSGTSVSLTPEVPLPDNTQITLKISAGGSILNGPGAAVPEQDVTFTTGAGPDFVVPSVILESPNYNGPGPQQQYVQTNSLFSFVFNEPLSPNSVLNNPNMYVYSYATNSRISGNITLSSDEKTVTFAPGPLTAGTQYQFCLNGMYDLSGNQGNGFCAYYNVVAGSSGAPQVNYTTPINGASNVPTNGVIDVAFNEYVNNQSLGQIVLTPISPAGSAVPVNASVVWDGTIVRVTPTSLLAPNTTYQLTIAGVTDLSGANTVTTQTVAFTTGANAQIGNSNTAFAAADVMVYGGGATQLPNYTNPGVTNVDGTQPITLTFTGPIEQASLYDNSVRLVSTLSDTPVPFTISLSNGGTTATITPTSPLSSATEYTLYINWNGTIYDQAGYSVANGAYFFFTTH